MSKGLACASPEHGPVLHWYVLLVGDVLVESPGCCNIGGYAVPCEKVNHPELGTVMLPAGSGSPGNILNHL